MLPERIKSTNSGVLLEASDMVVHVKEGLSSAEGAKLIRTIKDQVSGSPSSRKAALLSLEELLLGTRVSIDCLRVGAKLLEEGKAGPVLVDDTRLQMSLVLGKLPPPMVSDLPLVSVSMKLPLVQVQRRPVVS